nr:MULTISPECIES: MFS transporter [unclassified Corynebacterium]
MSATPDRLSRKAVTIWFAATCVYILAITGRTSFGVAGVAAMDRFQVDANALAVFTTLQIGVYAASQIPMGLAIDRFGPKKMLLIGALIMGLGQILLGFAPSYGWALAARVPIGMGDATAFLSVLRIIPEWIPAKRAPVFLQFTTALGQFGQVLSAIPFFLVLQAPWGGWPQAFVGLGAVGIINAFAAGLLITTSHTPSASGQRMLAHLKANLRQVVRSRVVWQAFFVHWVGVAPSAIFLLLWGAPLMKLGMGLAPADVAFAFSVQTFAGALAAPVHGWISSRAGVRRGDVAVLAAGASLVLLLWFFATDSPRGVAAVTFMLIVLAMLVPASSFGFDTVRERMPLPVLATATGLANMGGFTATVIGSQALGWLLVQHNPAGTYSWPDFRFAWLAVGAVIVAGMAGYVVARAGETGRRGSWAK